MRPSVLLAAVAALPFIAAGPLAKYGSNLTLEVDEAPQSPRPYVIRHYAEAHAVAVGSQIYRFPVTGNSSGGAFSLLWTNAPGSTSLGVLPHIHEAHYECFFNYKGRYQLWAQHDGEQEARELTAGDFGAVPPGTNHTFQIIDPDTELLGVIAPGGFEALFLALGTAWSSATNTPYVPAPDETSSSSGDSSSEISALEAFDVYAQLDFVPRRDIVNGSAPSSSVWHTGSNDLANDTVTPYFVANTYGPKYLNGQSFYQIVQPLITPSSSGEYAFTMSTISIDQKLANQTISTPQLSGHSAFEVIEGALDITISGFPTTTLYTGDVAFVPGNVTFSYQSPASFTKVLYVGQGHDGLDQQLIQQGQSWDYATFPLY